MKFFTLDIGDTFNLYVISDFHYDNPNSDHLALQDARQRIKKDPRGYCIIPGDLTDAETITHSHYRPDIKKKILTPLEVMGNVYNFLLPIKNKILVIGDGNHELRLMVYGNMGEWLAKTLDTRYGEYTFRINFHNRNKHLFNLFWTHGRRQIYSYASDPRVRQANLETQLIRRLKYKMGDCLVMGRSHCHRLLVVPPSQELFLYGNGEDLKAGQDLAKASIVKGDFIPYEFRWYIQSGGFLKLYNVNSPGYGEALDVDPLSIGFIKIVVESGRIKDVEKIEYL